MPNRQDEATSPTNLLAARIADGLEFLRWDIEEVVLVSPNSLNEAARLLVTHHDGTKHRITVTAVHAASS